MRQSTPQARQVRERGRGVAGGGPVSLAPHGFSAYLSYVCEGCWQQVREEVLSDFWLFPRWCPTCRVILRQAHTLRVLVDRDRMQINSPIDSEVPE